MLSHLLHKMIERLSAAARGRDYIGAVAASKGVKRSPALTERIGDGG
jgi:hypothetical protein